MTKSEALQEVARLVQSGVDAFAVPACGLAEAYRWATDPFLRAVSDLSYEVIVRKPVIVCDEVGPVDASEIVY